VGRAASRPGPAAAAAPGAAPSCPGRPGARPAGVRPRIPGGQGGGGAGTIRDFLKIGAITEARIFTLPIMIGSGVRLFAEAPGLNLEWRLESSKVHAAGVVENWYRKAD